MTGMELLPIFCTVEVSSEVWHDLSFHVVGGLLAFETASHNLCSSSPWAHARRHHRRIRTTTNNNASFSATPTSQPSPTVHRSPLWASSPKPSSLHSLIGRPSRCTAIWSFMPPAPRSTKSTASSLTPGVWRTILARLQIIWSSFLRRRACVCDRTRDENCANDVSGFDTYTREFGYGECRYWGGADERREWAVDGWFRRRRAGRGL